MPISLTDNLKKEYENLFNTCNINQSKVAIIENITNKILANKNRYDAVGNPLGIPWYFIGVIHSMESGLSFNKHLHNGDPLTARTIHDPKNRPVNGDPPFTWEESATDALQLKKLNQWSDWSVPGLLYKLEEYNGWGYRQSHPQTLSPYLWSFSNHYTMGKYISDNKWSNTAVSQQCGSAVLLRRIAEKGDIQIGANVTQSSILAEPILKYSKKKIDYGIDLQQFLNKFPNVFLKEDGTPGDNTSGAVKKIFGFYLKGDSRK